MSIYFINFKDVLFRLENDLLRTPVKGNQPEIVMRSSRRKAAIISSPPSTPKSITKKRKSPEEKSIEASERAAKKLKKDPPHAIGTSVFFFTSLWNN